MTHIYWRVEGNQTVPECKCFRMTGRDFDARAEYYVGKPLHQQHEGRAKDSWGPRIEQLPNYRNPFKPSGDGHVWIVEAAHANQINPRLANEPSDLSNTAVESESET